MGEELVSILIPVYNRENLVGETIESAINQTYKNIEIIIIDNCSTDGTWELLLRYAEKDNRIRIFRNHENIGPVRNWKRCVDEAQGYYAKILFSDDLISLDFIEGCLKEFDNKTGFVMSSIQTFVDDRIVNSNIFKKEVYSQHEYLYYSMIQNKENFPLSPGNAIFRRLDLKEAILIDLPNPYNWDYSATGAGNDLLILCFIALKYDYIRVSSKAIASFRGHDNSITSKKFNNINDLYGYAKVYFVNNYMPLLKNDLKTKILCKNAFKFHVKIIYSNINGHFSFISLFKYLLFKIKK